MEDKQTLLDAKIKIGALLDELIDSQDDWRNTSPMGKQTEAIIALKGITKEVEDLLLSQRQQILELIKEAKIPVVEGKTYYGGEPSIVWNKKLDDLAKRIGGM